MPQIIGPKQSMLDLKKAFKNQDALQKNCHNRRAQVDVSHLGELLRAHADLRPQLQTLKEAQNKIAQNIKVFTPSLGEREKLISRGRQLKDQIAVLGEREKTLERDIQELAQQLPNWTHPAVPTNSANMGNIIRHWGSIPNFSHPIRTHQELAEQHGLVDFAAGTAVAGPKFVYLRDRAVLIEQALIQMVLKILIKRGFSLYTTPDLARQEVVEGLGFYPRGKESQIYSVKDSELCLIGTSEITLGGMLRNRLFQSSDLPMKLAGLSHCFRTEAGAHGKDSKGLYRLHQFTKVEMFVAVSQELSESCLDQLVEIQEEVLQGLKLPYRVIDMPSGDLGGPAYRKYDIEVWMPGRGAKGEYGEVTSASNCTDFQARRLKIRYQNGIEKQLAHTLNATAIATSRILLALFENGQQDNGSIELPAELAELCGFDRIG